jgi:hypothetical protein
MIDVGNKVIADYIASLQSSNEVSSAPFAIINATEALAEFYATTIEFEREGRAIIPPEHFERAHSLQVNWGYIFRDTVQELFKLLQTLIECGPDDEVDFSFSIEMPKTLDDFNAEIEKLFD